MSNPFTEKLKVFMITKKRDILQKDLAKAIGCSPSRLSNIMTSKFPPDVDFLIRCKKYFALSDEETVDFFISAFSFAKTIPSDTTSYLDEERRKLLGTIITVLLLLPRHTTDPEIEKNMDYLRKSIAKQIDMCYDDLVRIEKVTHLEIAKIKDSKDDRVTQNDII